MLAVWDRLKESEIFEWMFAAASAITFMVGVIFAIIRHCVAKEPNVMVFEYAP
jgi:hypothetical protein